MPETDSTRYIACRPISTEQGLVPAGDEVLGAAQWRNVHVWVGAFHIRVATPEDLERIDGPAPAEPEAVEAAPAPEPEPAPDAPDDDAPEAEPAPAGLAALLAAVVDYPSSHTISELVEAAKAEGVEVPEDLPRRKAAVVSILADNAGITL